MNVLPIEKRAQILHLLVEGNSMRAASRIADVSINTVTKLLVDAGTACLAFQDEAPAMEAGISDHIWSMEEIADLVKVEAPKKRGPYKKKNSN